MKHLRYFTLSLALLAGAIYSSAQERIITRGQEVSTNGNMPSIGSKAPDFTGTDKSMNDVALSSFNGKYIVLNIFPSLDTPTCAMSVRQFNEAASALDNTVVLCISKDLPFAQSRFCSVEGIDNVVPLSLFRSESFDEGYGLVITEGPMKGLTARAVIVLDPEGTVIYRQLVTNTSEEPDYDKALDATRNKYQK